MQHMGNGVYNKDLGAYMFSPPKNYRFKLSILLICNHWWAGLTTGFFFLTGALAISSSLPVHSKMILHKYSQHPYIKDTIIMDNYRYKLHRKVWGNTVATKYIFLNSTQDLKPLV